MYTQWPRMRPKRIATCEHVIYRLDKQEAANPATGISQLPLKFTRCFLNN